MEITMASIVLQQWAPLRFFGESRRINQQEEQPMGVKYSPIKEIMVKSITPHKSHVNAFLGERAIVGDIKHTPLGSGGEKTVYNVNFEACGRHYALNVAHPHLRVKSDLDSLFFGVKKVSDDSTLGLSRIAVVDLKHLMQQNPTLPVSKQLNQIIRPFLRAIKSIHDQGFVHCDIKLQNALYKLNENGDYMVEPSDLGMAQQIGENRRFCGTYSNIPPELYDFYGKAQHNKNHQTSPVTLPKINVNTKQDVWGLGSMIALIVTKKDLGTVLNTVYGLKTFRQNLLQIKDCRQTKDLPDTEQKQKARVETNFSYDLTYKHPDYNTQTIIDEFCSDTTDPLGRQILPAIKNCFAINPGDRPTVNELITELTRIAGLDTGATQSGLITGAASEPTISPTSKRTSSTVIESEYQPPSKKLQFKEEPTPRPVG